MNSDCYVYIMTNWNNKVLYVGMTHDIVRRVYEHKNGVFEGFTKKYHCKKLVFFTTFKMTVDAIACEKRFKKLSVRTGKLFVWEEDTLGLRPRYEGWGEYLGRYTRAAPSV